ncbi:MAG: class I SAM-dependent methyltransferase [Gammaproteobacteria bacterium]|nr:class I SAM-dependent methyltransferase [Gammaproteobacteria bacterium]MCW8910613.1 class I SAM-dependent methyltransferase [Gammaproteobacteria bacterium]MCW9003659.1 class I SAM-dependent methyltransferase [Gammaproteobacteria bacterium]MCW9055762.1 class I SAM-dependent methyltransferase [Gammaproteobacteria bacterium]
MSCCCPHAQSASRFFSFFARRYRQRFEKKGFEPSQKQLMEGLSQAGYQGLTILEVGSGVGHVHQTLLEQGAASAVGIDLAPEMIKEAERWAEDRGLTERTRYIEGDFIHQTNEIETADVCVMDKVVCCYPDAEALVKITLTKTSKIYALTYPRNKWYVRLAIGLAAFMLKLIRSDFRPYVHDPELIEHWIADQGYSKTYEARTFVWLTQVYTQ